MKKGFIMIFIAMLLPLGVASAETPIYLSHSLIGYNASADSVTLNYSLHVENLGDSTFYNLTFFNVPLMIITPEEISLNIGNLEPRGSIDISFSLVTPMLLSEGEFSEQPLFWAGKYFDGNGNPIEFPAVSRSIIPGDVR